MDIARLRAEFPALAREANGHPLVYLDTAASAQKPRAVLEAMESFYREHYANVHRGVYAMSAEATDLFEGTRETVAKFLHASDPNEVVFTRGTTESLNLLASGLGRTRLRKDDRVLATIMEHHSNIVPWDFLRQAGGVALDFADITEEGRIDLDGYRALLQRRPKVVTFTHASNVLGTVNPVREMTELAHDQGALVVLDAAQSVAHVPIDVRQLGVDFLAFSGHKVFGPTGIGVLWGRAELLETLPPFLGGGDMIQEVHTDRVLYREPPARFEAGTPPIAEAIGLGAALRFVEGVGWPEIASHERSLTQYFLTESPARFGDEIHVFGPTTPEDREPTFSFTFEGVHPHDVASLVDAEGVAIRSGHHCAQPLMERLHVPALSRASASIYNRPEEFDRLFDALGNVRKLLGTPTRRASA
jgi:cysteine desulfurase/selenocysteine lyase